MRRHFRFVGGVVLVAAAAAAGCSDDSRQASAAGTGAGGGAGSGHGGAAQAGSGGSGAVGGSGVGTGGTADTGGTAGTGTGGSAGSAGATGTGGAGGAGTGGAVGTGGGGSSGTGGAAGSGGTGGAGGAGGTTGSGGTTGAGGTTGSAGTTGTGGTGGAGGAVGSGGSGGTFAAPAPMGAAVLNSDFFSTSLSILNTQGSVVHGDCVHTTTTGTGAKTISGDVVLPSQPQRGGQVVLIDRGNTALTFVNASTCAFDRQLSVKGGFNLANPHDVVIVSDRKAYVTRYGKNAAPQNALAGGDDLLIIDPRDGTINGHIDLSAYASATYPASPDRAIIAAGKVVVTLNRWNSTDYTNDVSSIVIVDPDTDQVVQNLELGGLINCEGMDVVAGTKIVLVACGGSFGSIEQALQAGIAVVDLSVTPAKIVRIVSSQVFPTAPLTFAWVLAYPSAASPSRAFTATLGSFSPSLPDTLYQFDYVGGGLASFGTASPFDLGMPAVGNGRLLVPDANSAMPRVHVFDTDALTESLAFVPDTANGLPPRQVAWY